MRTKTSRQRWLKRITVSTSTAILLSRAHLLLAGAGSRGFKIGARSPALGYHRSRRCRPGVFALERSRRAATLRGNLNCIMSWRQKGEGFKGQRIAHLREPLRATHGLSTKDYRQRNKV